MIDSQNFFKEFRVGIAGHQKQAQSHVAVQNMAHDVADFLRKFSTFLDTLPEKGDKIKYTDVHLSNGFAETHPRHWSTPQILTLSGMVTPRGKAYLYQQFSSPCNPILQISFLPSGNIWVFLDAQVNAPDLNRVGSQSVFYLGDASITNRLDYPWIKPTFDESYLPTERVTLHPVRGFDLGRDANPLRKAFHAVSDCMLELDLPIGKKVPEDHTLNWPLNLGIQDLRNAPLCVVGGFHIHAGINALEKLLPHLCDVLIRNHFPAAHDRLVLHNAAMGVAAEEVQSPVAQPASSSNSLVAKFLKGVGLGRWLGSDRNATPSGAPPALPAPDDPHI